VYRIPSQQLKLIGRKLTINETAKMKMKQRCQHRCNSRI